MKLNHVEISVTSLERSLEFYKEMLGMDIAAAPFLFSGSLFEQVMALDNAQGGMSVLRKGGVQLELFEFSHPRPALKDPNYSVGDREKSHFGIEVADIEATYERLAGAGATFHCPVLTFMGGLKATYAQDPDGNVFELLELNPATPT